jgi:hypothetical protein
VKNLKKTEKISPDKVNWKDFEMPPDKVEKMLFSKVNNFEEIVHGLKKDLGLTDAD